jgi:apolipoprotein N-acyltransferase
MKALKNNFILSSLTGLLLSAAWFNNNTTLLIFVAFVPLLFVIQNNYPQKNLLLHCFWAMLLFNSLTTWWIWNSTAIGALFAIVANSWLMCLPFWLFIKLHKTIPTLKFFVLVGFWMLFEWIHLNWQLSWPWLTLGNVFANKTILIQWYEFTGVAGGTLWIWIMNILIFQFINSYKTNSRKKIITKGLVILTIFIIPTIFSVLLKFHMVTPPPQKNIVIVQPNIDPYQKFGFISPAEQVNKLIALTKNSIDSNTALIVWPETALSGNVDISLVQQANLYQQIFEFVQQHPSATILTGIETYKVLGPNSESVYAQKSAEGIYYESYNAATTISANKNLHYHIKSKLVPGVETLPTFLNILAPVFEKFGGTTGGYAKDDAIHVLYSKDSTYKIAPIICYESIYGEYITEFIKNGANIIAIITNDGWWGNTPGYKQHLSYAKLRAIETRRCIARSANTGVSAFINQYGDIQENLGWAKEGSIKYNLPTKERLTFYTIYGDYLYKAAALLSLLIFIYFMAIKFKKK